MCIFLILAHSFVHIDMFSIIVCQISFAMKLRLHQFRCPVTVQAFYSSKSLDNPFFYVQYILLHFFLQHSSNLVLSPPGGPKDWIGVLCDSSRRPPVQLIAAHVLLPLRETFGERADCVPEEGLASALLLHHLPRDTFARCQRSHKDVHYLPKVSSTHIVQSYLRINAGCNVWDEQSWTLSFSQGNISASRRHPGSRCKRSHAELLQPELPDLFQC